MTKDTSIGRILFFKKVSVHLGRYWFLNKDGSFELGIYIVTHVESHFEDHFILPFCSWYITPGSNKVLEGRNYRKYASPLR